jgi:hypothetical protein
MLGAATMLRTAQALTAVAEVITPIAAVTTILRLADRAVQRPRAQPHAGERLDVLQQAVAVLRA